MSVVPEAAPAPAPRETAPKAATNGTSQSGPVNRESLRTMTYEQQVDAVTPRGRIGVVGPSQAPRVTYPTEENGLVTTELMGRLKKDGQQIADAIGGAADGERKFGTTPQGGEERSGVDVGTSGGGANRRRSAVVVANRDYAENAPMGNTPEGARDLNQDVVADGDVFQSQLGATHDPVTRDDDQTGPQIEGLLRAQLAASKAGDEVVFAYSGHGVMGGLVGTDGSMWSPGQASAITSDARGKGIDFMLALDACHAGIFADSIRTDELGVAAASVGGASASPDLQALQGALEAATALQELKNALNTEWEAWHIRRPTAEQALMDVYKNVPEGEDGEEPPEHAAAGLVFEVFSNEQSAIWNRFVAAANPVLEALATAAPTLAALTLAPVQSEFTQVQLNHVMAGLDDCDTLTNQVLDSVAAAA